MTYNAAIEKIMPEVEKSSEEPFIIYRDKNGGWHSDFTQNQNGKTFGWVKDAKSIDAYAVIFTGAYFARDSYPLVYDKVMSERLRMEFDDAQLSGQEERDYQSLLKFAQDNFSRLSPDTADYIIGFDKPLAELGKMIPYSLFSYDRDNGYNTRKAKESIDIIEDKITDMIKHSADNPISKNPEKRNIEGYIERFSIDLAGESVVIAENKTNDYPYLVCNIKRDNPLGIEERYNGSVTGNYNEAVREYTQRVETLLVALEQERRSSGLPFHTLTAKDCIPNKRTADWENKLIIVKADILAPEYRSAEHQLVLCMGGFGAKANARGNAVYVKELFSGKECRYDRYQIEGLANPRKMPDWVDEKLMEYAKDGKQAISADSAAKTTAKPQQKTKPAAKKKPSLQEKLDDAKNKAAQVAEGRTEHGNKTKNQYDSR